MTYAILPDRAVLGVSGVDAQEFLQGLITNDIRKVSAGQAIFSALLSPQGKFLHDFFIIAHEDKLLLESEKTRLPDLIKKLKMYKLRSKVEFAEMPEMSVAVQWGEKSDQWPLACDNISYIDPRLRELGMRTLVHKVPAFAGTTEEYDQYRLALGVPDGSKDLIIDRSLLLEYGYDELNAVDFTKGCYVGQEVTARTKHRATLRKFIHTVHADMPLPPVDTPVMAGEREVGIMRSSGGNTGLALLNVTDAKRANMQLTSAGIPLTAALPAWCKTSFEQDAK